MKLIDRIKEEYKRRKDVCELVLSNPTREEYAEGIKKLSKEECTRFVYVNSLIAFFIRNPVIKVAAQHREETKYYGAGDEIKFKEFPKEKFAKSSWETVKKLRKKLKTVDEWIEMNAGWGYIMPEEEIKKEKKKVIEKCLEKEKLDLDYIKKETDYSNLTLMAKLAVINEWIEINNVFDNTISEEEIKNKKRKTIEEFLEDNEEAKRVLNEETSYEKLVEQIINKYLRLRDAIKRPKIDEEFDKYVNKIGKELTDLGVYNHNYQYLTTEHRRAYGKKTNYLSLAVAGGLAAITGLILSLDKSNLRFINGPLWIFNTITWSINLRLYRANHGISNIARGAEVADYYLKKLKEEFNVFPKLQQPTKEKL